jgi:N-methylhydantoinase A
LIRVAFDIGGTFTDFVLHDSRSGETATLKVPTTPDDPSLAVLAGLRDLLEKASARPGDVASLLHATTVATNAVLERKGAPTGLITTAGFRDVLLIGRQKRYETYDLYIDKPKPMVERRYIVEVNERMAPDGTVVSALDMDSVDRAIDVVLAERREAVAVCLLHAYANPDHERRIRARIRERAPGLLVSISSEVSPKFREYERTSTTVANAYVRPVVARYVEHLVGALTMQGFDEHLLIMQSNGGLVPPDIAREFPVRIIESGPAAGILMCAHVGKAEGCNQILTFDMGGTTAKLGAIDDGTPAIMPTFEVDLVRHRRGSGLPINVPAVEMLEIGAGGGSIARVDRGMIAVGPDSAGASPGPICYGRGGTQPTITDANVVLGYIAPDWFNAGAMPLDAKAAEEGIRTEIATPLGLSVPEAAWGIHLIATSSMENALRLVSIERGRDPRNYTMLAFGGAGPIHAARIARQAGIARVIIPGGAGVGSALGLLQAAPRLDVTATRLLRLDAPGAAATIAAVYENLEAQARSELARLGSESAIQWSRYAQMRYAGQGFELHVDLPSGAIDDAYIAQVQQAFSRAYMRKNKFVDEQGVVEGVDWTLVASLPDPEASARPAISTTVAAPGRSGTRPAWFPEADGYVDTRILDRSALANGERVTGPAIVEDPDCTVVVPPDDVVLMNSDGHLVIDIANGGRP